MLKYILIVSLLPLFALAQNDPVPDVEEPVIITEASEDIDLLRKELAGIRDGNSFIQYFSDHAAGYSDFDSVYMILHNKKCPENYSYDLLHGKLKNYPVKMEMSFLYLLCRNFQSRTAKDKGKPLPADFMLLSESFNTSKSDLVSADSTYIMQYTIREAQTTFRTWDTIVSVGKDFFTTNNTTYFSGSMTFFQAIDRIPDNRLLNKKNKLISWFGIDPKAKSIPVKGKTDDAKALVKYMHAQFFNDIIFMKINGKFVWMDVSR
ncbi:MAG: hypothetical protein K0S33_769 [Bacteroidetes bacterium]|jgi:hypothetical protein|nr:hypothetical protein [Bacteroidota bacterium]